MNKPNFESIAKCVVKRANEHELNAYIWHVATTGSIYIRFKDNRMCSIRIGNHNGREKYKYKFNMRSDIRRKRLEKDKEIWRLYFPVGDINNLIEALLERKKRIQTWKETKYHYGIPYFKKVKK